MRRSGHPLLPAPDARYRRAIALHSQSPPPRSGSGQPRPPPPAGPGQRLALVTKAALSATSRSTSAKSRACRARSALTSACARARSPAVAARSASSLFARASATARLRDLPTVTVASAVASERIRAMVACCYEMHPSRRWRSWDSASAASARRHREFSTGSMPENRLSTSLEGRPYRRKGSAGLSCGYSHATHRSPRAPRLFRGAGRPVNTTDTA